MYPFKRFSLGELRNINASQHRAVGNPLVYDFLIRPYCTLLQKAIPKTVAPNTITWVGFVAMAASFFATMYSDPLLTGPCRWLSFLNAVSTLVYITTDSLDGIHARATGQCSPLGKILDHFVDSIAVLFAAITLCSSLRMGYSAIAQTIIASIMLGFYVAALSERYTGYMRFSPISGACEGLLCITCIHAISFVSPSAIETALYSGRYLSRAYVGELLLVWSVIYIFHIFINLFRDISKQHGKKNHRAIATHIIRPVLLVLMTSPLFSFGCKSQSPFMLLSYLMVYGNSFSLCYLEDYIASMSKMPADHKVFAYAFLILGAQGIVHSSNAVAIARLLLLVSTLHFVIRSGLVLKSLAKSLNTKLFTRTF